MNYMGVDVGTSGCKAVVFDERGSQVSSAYREYDLILSDDGGAELDSDNVMKQCFTVMREAAGGAGEPVRGIGISSQGEAFTAVDGDGNALSNGMVTSDVRSAPYVAQFPGSFGEDRLYQITGHTAHTMFTLFKILWLRDNRPEAWANARMFLCMEDLLQLHLGLDPAISWSLAGRTMMFDVRKHEWSEEILSAAGVREDQLARPMPSGQLAGHPNEKIIADLGLAPGACVVVGGHDQVAGALGAGATEPGVAMYATGTTECIAAAFSHPVFTDEMRDGNLCTYDHTVDGLYATLAFSLTGGNILKWFRDEFGAMEVAEGERTGVDAYELLLKSAPSEPTSLMVLPYFTPSGTPHFDMTTPGAILGLRLGTGRGEIIRALLEGVALEMRLNVNTLERSGCPVTELRAIGGGAKSAYWVQLKANVIGKPITVLNVTEAACLGMAMLACAADTDTSLGDLASKWVHTVDTVHPQPDFAAVYDRKFEAYKKLHPAIENVALA